jgi:hypothetical protein
MGVPDGAHTHGSGGSGLGPVVLVILAVALLGPAVAAAAVELVHILVIVAAVIIGLGAAGLVAVVAFRVRRAGLETPRVVHRITPAAPRPSPLPSEPRQAIGQPGAVLLHLHGYPLRTSPPSSSATARMARNGGPENVASGWTIPAMPMRVACRP